MDILFATKMPENRPSGLVAEVVKSKRTTFPSHITRHNTVYTYVGVIKDSTGARYASYIDGTLAKR